MEVRIDRFSMPFDVFPHYLYIVHKTAFVIFAELKALRYILVL